MQRMWFLVWVALVAGCTDDKNVSPAMSTTAEEEMITVEIARGTMLPQALSVITENGWNPEAVVTIAWPDHQGEIGLVAGKKEEQEDELLRAERARLMFLLGQFDPAVRVEAAVYVQLAEDLLAVAGGRMVSIRAIRLRAFDAPPDVGKREFVAGVFRHTAPPADFLAREKTPDVGSAPIGTGKFALTDFPNDAAYTPAGGTSTIWPEGTLQKFWMDDASANSFNAARDGIEIDTRVIPANHASCGNNWNSNMPDAYLDSTFSDVFSTTCGVGTISAAALAPWTLYWTWRTFSGFAPRNTTFQMQFQPSTWCWWVRNVAECRGSKAWCMCTRDDMPIETMIQYDYSEAPGMEVRWVKN